MSQTTVEPELPPPMDLLAGYPRGEALFDEAFSTGGELVPHYAQFIEAIQKLGPPELKRRRESCRRLLHEQGITYNVYGESKARGVEQPWQLDPIPLVIAPEEWRSLEAALIQRATLINTILGRLLRPAAN